ncbi:MAG: bifunctional 3,4-dihydroxy-2-butanone-4-phosphate synthase/GTP cyclohydrolase II [Vicinamibacterales bacterium]
MASRRPRSSRPSSPAPAAAPARPAARRRQASGPFATVETAIAAIRRGGLVIVVDDADRENEGDLTIAAEKVTPEAINFMMREGRGLICMPMTAARLDELEIPLQVPANRNTTTFDTAFCVGIEARRGVTTGISAADRARTILTAIHRKTRPEDLARPGHVLPLRARDGGVLVRAGQTEAAVDLARIAGLYPAGVICEIAKADGSMARVPDLVKFARRHKLPLISVADLIRYRMRTERLVTRVAEADLPTVHGKFRVHAYESPLDGETHVALVCGAVGDGRSVLVRVHSKCLTGDVFHSTRCDCGPQFDAAMQRIAAEGRGVLLYLNQEGRGIGLANKIKAYALQDRGFDTVEANERLGFKADQRDYGIGAQILRDLGIRTMRLLTNNPRKFVGLQGYGLAVAASVPLEIAPSATTRRYLKTKKDKLGHRLTKV